MLRDWLEPDPDLEEAHREPTGWGPREALLALVVAQIAAMVGSLVIFNAAGYSSVEEWADAPLWVQLLTQIPLWAGYAGVTLWVVTRVGRGPELDLGWRFRRRDVPYGLTLGVLLQIVAVPVLYVPILLLFPDQDVSEAARDLTDRATEPASVIALLLVVVVGAPIVEELFFRGLLLRSVARRWGTAAGLVLSTAVFGLVHLQLLQLPALLLFGGVAAWLTVRSGRLGPAVWTHVGFNAVTVLLLLFVE
ncbi:type II CAAX endopeptidase family protein [Actinomarinicola tropica]|uniref:CPBP family intramembrane metalloprotease n=1 Tax=Actinomarinicola tropica TaxID=2789776 RepID=A0A5Q2RNY3_9ACTN|nr:type II CAAX endopeptidase family protein [Actinomarinicola tropica]QGG95807.1 CPBP family intramembrane metalloprotease [Actinomarinicola tropica]